MSGCGLGLSGVGGVVVMGHELCVTFCVMCFCGGFVGGWGCTYGL